MNDTYRVLILGGGIGGLAVARRLAGDARFAITLIDRQNHYVFQPLLYQVATAALSSADIAVPIRFLLRRAGNVRVLQAEALRIDVAARSVATTCGDLPYDALVVATGVEPSYFGRPDWERIAPPLKTLADAARIRERVLAAFERAEVLDDPAARARELTFVVVGGGPTGVELAGALAELARDALQRDFRRIDPRDARIVLVEAGPRLLTMFAPSLAESARRFLVGHGVEVLLDTRVTELTAAGVSIGDRFVPAANVMWGAGVTGSPLADGLPVARDALGRVRVAPDCSLPGHPEVFVIGDLAHFRPAGKPAELPAVGGVALQMGHHVARLLAADRERLPRRPFAYFDRGQMATIGRNHAIAEVRRVRLAGRVAWWMWLFIHLVFLAGFRNRLTVLLQWGWSYLTLERGSRVILQPATRRQPEPAAETGLAATSPDAADRSAA